MSEPETSPIEVSLVMHTVLRWGLGIFGAIIMLVATTELWRALWPISIVTPFFGLMLGIALFAGGGLVFGAVFGPDETWRIESGQLAIRQSLRGRLATRHYGPANIASITIHTSDWDSRPDSYSLVIRLIDGKQLKSPEFGTQAAAERAARLIQAPG